MVEIWGYLAAGGGRGASDTFFFDRYTPQLLFFNLLNIMRWTGFELVFSDLKKKNGFASLCYRECNILN